ncbi:MAG: type II toxin-antitoxin system PemK/MazF family toxin [Candidatus Omnitrophica bacterium]|nr:type II toxin-antitoxin system PemK/MazF family toxin [Candidatus Omnitrophota bacterium]
MRGKRETSLSSKIFIPLRGEIWEVALDPIVGSEMNKSRPCLVLSSDAMGKLPIKIVAPITEWKAAYINHIWHIRIDPDAQNNLIKSSAVDVYQVRAVDTKRFVKHIGKASAQILEEAAAALAAVVEHQ